ncbi:hypothetical protein K470DRAFT_67403 [Piedraia hortae CBS 480.64]|uniref:Uncharacterized protein n=1 Tax=Piedraia hortae CBS 480.64 TaxID=1314780 RepID=A0A6A7BZ98_9PEZI|nr:hypothetical protein K470DRAFT_67403 [Piedraia hortae CBS 480.64]
MFFAHDAFLSKFGAQYLVPAVLAKYIGELCCTQGRFYDASHWAHKALAGYEHVLGQSHYATKATLEKLEHLDSLLCIEPSTGDSSQPVRIVWAEGGVGFEGSRRLEVRVIEI